MKIIVNETQYNKLLKEQRGFSKASEDWARVITDKVMETLFDIDKEDVITMGKLHQMYGNEDFYQKLPIESILVTINIERVEGEDGGADGAYIPKWSHLEDDVIKNKEVVEDVEFDIIMKLPATADKENSGQVVSDHLFQIFSHELLHVNEWYNRDLENPAEMTDCMGLYIDGDLHGNAVEKLAYMIYTQLSFEMNAFIHQAGTMLRMRDIRSYDEFMEELHTLIIWDFVEAMLEFNPEDVLKEIEGLGDKDKELLNNIKICYYSTRDEEGEMAINPKSVGYTTERFLADMSKRFRVRGTAMKRKLHKMATDVINEGTRINEQLENITLTGEKVSDFDIELDGEIIRRWSKNNKEHVERIQKMLVSLDYDIGGYGPDGDGIDGKYGKYTEKGVKEFQEDMMPEDPNQWDGVLGPITYNHLKGEVDNKAEDEGVETDELVDSVKGDFDSGVRASIRGLLKNRSNTDSGLVVKGNNGNIPEEKLTYVGKDINGNEEYLDKNAGIMFNKMREDALNGGVKIKLSDAYRPCGEPGDYERYKDGEIRFSQWAAWEENDFNGQLAARPKPDTAEKWISKGGGRCTSNHGLGKAIDVAGSEGKKWVKNNGKKYGFVPYWKEDWHFDFKEHKVDSEFKNLLT